MIDVTPVTLGPTYYYCVFPHVKADGTATVANVNNFQFFDPSSDVAQGRTVKFYTQQTATDNTKWINANTMPGGVAIYACLTGELAHGTDDRP